MGITRSVAEMIALGNQPFSVVDNTKAIIIVL